MTEWITSDTHYGHKNMTGANSFLHTRRHFKDVQEMDATLIARHNAVVAPLDTVIHLGDVGLHMKNPAFLEVLTKLNGHFIIVQGNHDNSKALRFIQAHNFLLGDGLPKFIIIHEVGFKRKVNGIVFYFSHYPLQLGEKRARMRNIHGHIHEFASAGANQLNVGIDSPEIGTRPFGQPLLLADAMARVNAKWEAWSLENPDTDGRHL